MNKMKTIILKEWAEVFKNRMVLFTVIFLPLILTALPLGILWAMGSSGDLADAEAMTTEMPSEMDAYCPPGLEGGECMQVFLASQFMMMFMILPLAIPVTISAYSIVGEKTTRSLEPLLATPITTLELLAGKSVAALIPAVLATFGAFGIFALGAYLMLPNKELFAALMDARWLLAIFLVGPLMALISIAVSVMVSSRVNDPRVAEQLSMVLIVPVLAAFFGQIAGLFVINRQLVLITAAVLIVMNFVLFYLAVRLFQRESILTRWK